MGMISNAVAEGAAHGTLVALWTTIGVLPDGADAVLYRPNRSDLSYEARGYRSGLVETGHLRRRWWGRYDRSIPVPGGSLIKTAIASSLSREDETLTKVGFEWAWIFAMERSGWGEEGRPAMVRQLWEYVGVPYGTEGYEWTASAAEDMARHYRDEFGEAA